MKIFRDDVVFAPVVDRRVAKISFGDAAKKGIAPLGLEYVLNACNLNNPALWCTSRPLLGHGVLCPKAKLSTAAIEQRIEAVAHLYPVTNKERALGVATHERDNLRGFHLIGDDDDIAALWASLYMYEEGIREWDVPGKAVCWTAMAPGCVYVPYLDIDEKGTEGDFHRVWTQRVGPTIACIQKALAVLPDLTRDGGGLPVPLIFFNTRRDGELWKFSFHVHWPTLGVSNINEWKAFLLSISELPRKLVWVHRDERWHVTEDPKTPIFDPAVYGGQRQLFRGPFCGKGGNVGAALLPCAMKTNDAGEYEFIPKKYSASEIKSYILRARIARWSVGLIMIGFSGRVCVGVPSLTDSEIVPPALAPRMAQQSVGNSGDLLDFVMPFFTLFILPRWQLKRKQDSLRLNTMGAQVPTKNIKITKDTAHRTRPGCRYMSVESDTFCSIDPAHVHTRSAAPIGLLVDFVRCTIQQTCFACGVSVRSEQFCFLHTNNRIDICTEADSSFTGLSYWTPSKAPYQLLLDYFSDLFVLQRSCRALWVYDREFRVWRTDLGGNAVIGTLIDELNEKHVKYLHSYKKVVVQRQLETYARMHQDADDGERALFEVKVNKEARKFMSDNTPFISIAPHARGKILDDLRNYNIHNEVKEMNCFAQYIPMKNKKCVNVYTGEVSDMEASHYFTSCVNAELIPLGDDTKRLEDWFKEITTGDLEKCVYLKRFAGYCFTYLVHDRKFLVLKGCGKNAKGAWKEFIMVISKGPEGMDSRAKNLLQNYWDKRGNANQNPENATPETFELNNKTFLYTDDIMPIPLDTNKIKRTVGAEDGSGRGLYGKPVDIHIRGKVVWTSNFDPDGPGEDNAYWERQTICPMLTKYVEPGQPVDHTQYRFAQNHAAYTELLELRDAFFTVVVNELVKYYRSLPWNEARMCPASLAAFPLPASVEKYGHEARARQLPLAGFMKEYTKKTPYPMEFCHVDDAFEAYMIFLENVNESKAKKDTTLTSFVKLLGIALEIVVEAGFIQGRAICKKIVSTKKRQYEERSYGQPLGVSAGMGQISPVDALDFAIGRQMPPSTG